MSYYKCRRAVMKKNGKISLTVADSSLRPLHYFTTEYDGTTAQFLQSVYEGNIHLKDNKASHQLYVLAEAVRSIVDLTTKRYGLSFDTVLRYHIEKQWKKIISVACEMYADRIEKSDFSDPERFGQELGTKISNAAQEAVDALKEEKEKDQLIGRIRIACAAKSIFKGYDLLYPYQSTNGPILAPEEDYNGGILQTDFNKIICLGEEAEDLYPFLSFSGINYSLEEYISTAKGDRGKIQKKFQLVDQVVRRCLDSGLDLIHPPYLGYVYAAA